MKVGADVARVRSLASSGVITGFAALFGFQVVLNVLVVAQQRAAVTLALGPSFIANVLLAGVTYFAVRLVVQGRSPALGVGYALGGGVGGIVGLYATRLLGL